MSASTATSKATPKVKTMVETIAHYASILGAFLVAIMARRHIKQMLCRHYWCDSFKREYREFCSKCGKRR